MDNAAETLKTYQTKDVVDLYDRTRELQTAEQILFDRYVKPGTDVLDLGVGAGRTTRFLAPLAKRYVGLDYADSMVARCRERFPELEFVCQDAADLSRFADASFDVVVFSFNGLGTLPTDDARRRCLREISRVLRPKGVFIFSLHNPKFVVFRPVLSDVGGAKAVWRLAYAAYQTTKNLRYRLLSQAFWSGEGYVTDPGQHSELQVYTCGPERVLSEIEDAGMSLLERRSAPEDGRGRLSTPHYYYATRKS